MKNAGGSIVNSFRNALFAPGGRDSRENDDENSESSTSSTHKAGSSSLPAISTPNGQSSSNNQGLSSPVGRVAASSTGMSPQVAKLSVSTSAKSPGKPAVVPMSPPMSPGGKNPKGMQICPPNVVITPTRQQQLPPPDDDDDDDLFNPYQFMHQIPPHAYVKIPNKIVLPPMQEPKHKITLVLDLDETLVHCSVEPIPKPDVIFPVLFNGVNYQVHVRKRPYLDFFLENIAPYYEVVLFTASQKVYADKLCEYIDPKQNMIRHRLFRDSCLCVQGNYIKDIDVLGRDMKSVRYF